MLEPKELGYTVVIDLHALYMCLSVCVCFPSKEKTALGYLVASFGFTEVVLYCLLLELMVSLSCLIFSSLPL